MLDFCSANDKDANPLATNKVLVLLYKIRDINIKMCVKLKKICWRGKFF